VRLAPARIATRDVAELERRAGALATGEVESQAAPSGALSVTFRLGGVPCGLEASAVERAVLRLATVFAVPLAAGGERTAAFVDERALPVVDLVRPARDVQTLRDAPALVLAIDSGPIAVAVEGPLELSEAALAVATEPAAADGDAPRLSGRLADGTSVLDAGWVRRFASRALSP
jgi:hypothetical protein